MSKKLSLNSVSKSQPGSVTKGKTQSSGLNTNSSTVIMALTQKSNMSEGCSSSSSSNKSHIMHSSPVCSAQKLYKFKSTQDATNQNGNSAVHKQIRKETRENSESNHDA